LMTTPLRCPLTPSRLRTDVLCEMLLINPKHEKPYSR
jgi:hypothetical protein